MDYQAVPRDVLNLSVKVSKAANAEYWACDIAVGKDGQYRILECATAFAAFPYIRDWIGQYLMWKLSSGHFNKPNIPLYNWEELGKINSSLLRSMRNIHFSKQPLDTVNDGCETFNTMSLGGYPISDTSMNLGEEWPSETWNLQDNYKRNLAAIESAAIASPDIELAAFTMGLSQAAVPIDTAQDKVAMNTVAAEVVDVEMVATDSALPLLSEVHLYRFFAGVKGIGRVLAENILDAFGTSGLVDALVNDPQKLTQVKNIKQKKLTNIIEYWQSEHWQSEYRQSERRDVLSKPDH